MHYDKQDYIGKKFGKWTIIKKDKHGYQCQCECGIIKNQSLFILKNKKSTQCYKCKQLILLRRGNIINNLHKTGRICLPKEDIIVTIPYELAKRAGITHESNIEIIGKLEYILIKAQEKK